MNERRYAREVERLRDPERVARLEVDRVVDLALADMPGAQSVIDIGTGSGLFAAEFAARGLAVTGVDVNPAMLPAAQGFVPAGTFRLAPAERLPFPDAAFDLAFMGVVLHEADDALQALQEARRVAVRRAVILEWPAEEQPFGPPLAHRMTDEQMQTLATQAGYTKVSSTRLQNVVLYRLEG